MDHSPSAVTWVDNHRVNNWLLAEPNDELCFFDPTQATCRHTSAVADTVVSSNGAATIRILAHDVTVRGFSVRAGALSESNGIYVGTPSGGSYRNVRILDNDVSTTGLGESGITGRFDNGLIDGNSIQGFRQGVYLRTHGKSVTVSDNTITNNGEGVLTYGYSPRIENNTISGSVVRGIGVANITSPAIGNVPFLHGNTFRGQTPAVGFRDTVTNMHVDARFNDWGEYTRADIESSMENLANGNTVDTRCYRNAAGTGFVCPPSAVTFTANPDPARWNRVMTFVADVTGGTSDIEARTWMFGDGATGTGTTAGHVYRASGSFDVTYTIRDADGYELQATRTVTTINNAPVFTTLQDQVVDVGQRVTLLVQATDPDGDVVLVQAGNIPIGATLSGPAAGRTFTWMPTQAQAGTHPVSFTASDGDLTTMYTVMVTVATPVEASRITLASVGPFVRNASPGELMTFHARVRNQGSEAQNVTFEPAGLAAWNVTVPAPVSVAAGESVLVSFTAVVPPRMASGYMGIKTGTGANTATVQYLVRMPISLQVALDDAPTIGDAVTGTVTARFLDGTPVSGAAMTLQQTPTLAKALASSDSGYTEASGTYAFTMSEPSASMPGTHELTATLRWAGDAWSKRTTYNPSV